MATHTFQIVVTQSGAQATAAAIGQVGAAAQKSASALQFFRQALVVASTIRAAAGMVDLIDAATRMENRLRVATKSTEEFARAQQFVSQISRQTRTDVEANAVTYSRLIRSTEGLGLSSEYLEKVMKGLALSVKVGGATSMEARNSLVQFSQSLASGALRGDELRSVAEQLPALANAIGKEFGISGGQLIAFAKATPGILETERVIKAVANAVPELQKEFDKTLPTLEEGFVSIRQGAIELFASINKATGVFGALSSALSFVGRNLNVVAVAAAGVVAVKYATAIAGWGAASTKFAGELGAMFSLMRQGNGIAASMSALFMVNPITIWIAAIAAAVVALVALYNYVPVVKTAVDNLFSAFAAVTEAFTLIKNAITQNLPSWVTFENTMKVVGTVVAALIQTFAVLFTAALYTAARVITGFVLILNSLGFATDETAKKMVEATGGLESFLMGLLRGKQGAVEAGTALTGAKDSIAGMINPLTGAKSGTDSLKEASKQLADEVKHLDENSALFVAGKFVNDGSWMRGSVEGFTNLARVTKDWEKYTTDAGTAVTTTATATQTAKTPTDQLAGSMKAVNTQASGAANASRTMATAMNASAESSTTAAKQVKEMSDIMAKLNPLLAAAKAAGEAAAAGFSAAGSAAAGAVGGVDALTEAFKRLAAAKSAAGQGGSSSGSSDFGGARAAGGPVLSGSTYLVGEKGPELFTAGATGNIIPNHALQSGGTTAANDNTVMIVKAINRMANAVVTSNKAAAKTNEQVVQELVVQNQNTAKALARSAVNLDQSTSFKGTGYQTEGVAFENDPKYNWKTYGESMLQYGMNYFAGQGPFGQQYTDPATYAEFMKDNKVLKGDEAYRANMQSATDSGINYFRSYNYDANDPYSAQIEDAASKLQMLEAALERYGIDAFAYSGIDIMGEIEQMKELVKTYQDKSAEATAKLKEYRDAGANFDQFQNALPEMAKVASKIQDFQTYTPMQGGKDFGSHDPYGIGSAPRPSEEAQAAMSAKGGTGAQDNRVQVQMTINTPNAESFRQNKAQIESQVAGMVDRANRRAGRK